jgi:hypothetical protein
MPDGTDHQAAARASEDFKAVSVFSLNVHGAVGLGLGNRNVRRQFVRRGLRGLAG